MKRLCESNRAHPGRLYYDLYRPYVSFDVPPFAVDGAMACQMDTLVDQTNAAIKAAMQAELGNRFVAVDLNVLLGDELDYKHRGAGHDVKINWRTESGATVALGLNNFVAHAGPEVLSTGGLFGFDNMHPSLVGYASFAQKVLAAIKEKEPAVGQNPGLVSPQAVADDLMAHGLPTVVGMDWLNDLRVGALHDYVTFEIVAPENVRGVRALIKMLKGAGAHGGRPAAATQAAR